MENREKKSLASISDTARSRARRRRDVRTFRVDPRAGNNRPVKSAQLTRTHRRRARPRRLPSPRSSPRGTRGTSSRAPPFFLFFPIGGKEQKRGPHRININGRQSSQTCIASERRVFLREARVTLPAAHGKQQFERGKKTRPLVNPSRRAGRWTAAVDRGFEGGIGIFFFSYLWFSSVLFFGTFL